ncbi:hypothetical protein [Streptomyces cinereoruber]|uniref:hypothetical protein n=1 Tax=Streptomyces cinereoruber TaxID=67260 RepID=UPI003651DBDD
MFHNTNEKAVLLESSEASRDDPVRAFEDASHLHNVDSGVPGRIGKNNPVPTVVTLQKIFPISPAAHTKKQSSRYASGIMSRLRRCGLQRTEGE